MACRHPLASFSCKNCPPSAPFACRGGDWPSFTSTALGGGDLTHLGHYNSRQPRRHQKFRPPHHPHGPWRGSYERRIFFFFHWREKSTPDGKNCLFFGFLCFFVFLVRIARFGIRKVFFMEFFHPAVHTFSGVVLDPKKL